MGWEKRSNGLYYYRKRREGGRVVSEYVGSGELAQAIATLDALDRQRRELERLDWQEQREEILGIARAGNEAQALILDLTRAWLLAQGYHTHKGQWRRKSERDGD
jgi:hypothetical protein